MNYLVAPLHAHFDSGFGATGNAFKEAADYLDKSEHAKENDLFNADLPINVLYRHAIELFLRSAIVIFHRRLRIPFGDAPWDGEPMVLVAERWEPFNRVHGIETLWAYVPKLFVQHAEWLAKNTKADWTLPVELDDQVKTIQQSDPRSTFFRYPTTKDSNADVSKSAMKEVTADELTERFRTSDPPKNKVFAMVVENDNREFVHGYVYDAENSAAFNTR